MKMKANIRKVITLKKAMPNTERRRREDQKRDTTMKTTRDIRTSMVMNPTILIMRSMARREASMEAQNTVSLLPMDTVDMEEAAAAAVAVMEDTINHHFKEAILCLTIIKILAWHTLDKK